MWIDARQAITEIEAGTQKIKIKAFQPLVFHAIKDGSLPLRRPEGFSVSAVSDRRKPTSVCGEPVKDRGQ